MTGQDGAYAFDGLLPGTYLVQEEERADYQRLRPAAGSGYGPFEIASGSEFLNNDFVNQSLATPAFSKAADKSSASTGEIVTYTLTYTNTGSLPIAGPFTIVDNYDQLYVTPVDANGGVDNGDTITWMDSSGLSPGESRTITYTLRVKSDMPEGTTYVKNSASLRWFGGELLSSWNVGVTVDSSGGTISGHKFVGTSSEQHPAGRLDHPALPRRRLDSLPDRHDGCRRLLPVQRLCPTVPTPSPRSRTWPTSA